MISRAVRYVTASSPEASRLRNQQNLAGSPLCIVVPHAPSNRYEDLTPLIADMRETLLTARPGQIVHLGKS